MVKKLTFIILILTLGLFGCSSSCKQVKQCKKDRAMKKVETKVNVSGKIYVSPVQDYTAGRMLSQVVAEDIYSELMGRIKGSKKYEVVPNKLLANYTLEVKMIEIAKGNKAVPFWVGAVSYPAKLIFTCDLIDSKGVVVDTLNYHAVGRGMARISDKEITYFKELTVDKICEWLKIAK